MTQEEQAARFGPSVEAYGAAREWLEQQGFRILEGSKNRLTLTAAGTRAQAERAFAVNIGDYTLSGKSVYAADRGPSVPAVLAGSVEAVIGLSNLARPVRARPLELIAEVKEAEKSGAPIGPDNLPYTCWVAGLMDLGDSASGIIDGAIESAKGGLNFSLSALSPAVTLLRFLCVADMLDMLNRLAAGLPPEAKGRIGRRYAGPACGNRAAAPESAQGARGQRRRRGAEDRPARIRQLPCVRRPGLPQPDRPWPADLQAVAGARRRRRRPARARPVGRSCSTSPPR
jgi:hypothetical protein